MNGGEKMTGKEAAACGREMGFPKYSQAAHSLANHPEDTGVMRVPELAAAMYGKGQKQEALVLTYIEAHGGITQRQASLELNVWRLAGVVKRLRNKGFPIITVSHPLPTGGNYAEYRLG